MKQAHRNINQGTAIMKTSLSFTALALLATGLIMPMQADAANRQISVNSKLQSFTVNNDAPAGADVADATPTAPKSKVTPKFFRVNDKPAGADIADTTADAPQPKVRPKFFRVDDKPAASEEASNDDTPVITPKKKNTFRFRVEDKSEQAATAPAEVGDDDVASSDSERPANLLNEKVKLVKKVRPAPVENNDDEATTDDTDHSAEIAADAGEDVTAEASDEPAVKQPGEGKNRMYYYASKQKSYEQIQDDDYAEAEPATYSYRQEYVPSYRHSYVSNDYAGSSCHQSYNGY
jgi:hypothetical protein